MMNKMLHVLLYTFSQRYRDRYLVELRIIERYGKEFNDTWYIENVDSFMKMNRKTGNFHANVENPAWWDNFITQAHALDKVLKQKEKVKNDK